MKLRLAAVLVLLSGGVVLWLTTTPSPQPAPPSAPPNAVPPRAARPIASPPPPAAEGNPEIPEETAAATSDAALAGPVAAPPKPMSLAAREELPAGPEPEPGAGSSPMLPPTTALENMRTAFRQYCLRLGGNPVGNNSEITAALNGQNPQQVVFLGPEDGTRINGRGELVDNWDTPYFFHQLSRTEMEVRSAGPDRRMWTSDDLVLK
jgi:hypothetical protein